jgi:hypothetical protein
MKSDVLYRLQELGLRNRPAQKEARVAFQALTVPAWALSMTPSPAIQAFGHNGIQPPTFGVTNGSMLDMLC